jgi:hypothetical protein
MVRAVCCTGRLPGAAEPSLPSGDALRALDGRIVDQIRRLPPRYHVDANDDLDPTGILPVIHLQNARILLHRTDLSPACGPEVRTAAADACLRISRETARLLARSMRDAGQPHPYSRSTRWEVTLRLAATAYLCTHLWRCSLILCFRSDYEAALVCARASAAIGGARPINAACGRYLEHFLHVLGATLRRDDGAGLDDGEDAVAYASGDLQGNLEHAWVWEPADDTPRSAYPGSDAISPVPADDGRRQWSGWDGIVAALQRLRDGQAHERERRRQLPPIVRPSSAQRKAAATLLTPQPGPVAGNAQASPGGGRDRMSIADLI